jgi:hypothetical protein
MADHRYCNDCEIVTFFSTCRHCGKPTSEIRTFEDYLHKRLREHEEKVASFLNTLHENLKPEYPTNAGGKADMPMMPTVCPLCGEEHGSIDCVQIQRGKAQRSAFEWSQMYENQYPMETQDDKPMEATPHIEVHDPVRFDLAGSRIAVTPQDMLRVQKLLQEIYTKKCVSHIDMHTIERVKQIAALLGLELHLDNG